MDAVSLFKDLVLVIGAGAFQAFITVQLLGWRVKQLEDAVKALTLNSTKYAERLAGLEATVRLLTNTEAA